MIIPIERIEREAAQAARHYSDINEACPYPFDSDAGRLFKQRFLTARENIAKNASSARLTGASSY